MNMLNLKNLWTEKTCIKQYREYYKDFSSTPFPYLLLPIFATSKDTK